MRFLTLIGRSPWFLTILLVSIFSFSRGHAQAQITGAWEAEAPANVFWGLHLRASGKVVTGVIQAPGDAFVIDDGTANNGDVAFQITLPNDRVVRFRGTLTGDTITFRREVVVREGGDPGGNGLLGASGPQQFVARRLPPGRSPRQPRGSRFPTQLTVYDRGGHILRTLGEPGPWGDPAFSPDGRHLAAGTINDIWVYDLSTGERRQVTSGRRIERMAMWPPDGQHIVYSAYQDNFGMVYRKRLDGEGDEQLVYRHTAATLPAVTSWSADGRFLYLSDSVLHVVEVGTGQPTELIREEYDVSGGYLSVDNRLYAYVSDETGRNEVYVRAVDPKTGRFAVPEKKWQVSEQGGDRPLRWRQDGRELLYLAADGHLMAVDVRTKDGFQARRSRRLFNIAKTVNVDVYGGSISADGQRFVFPVPIPPSIAAVSVPPDILARYVGTYALQDGTELSIALERDQLVVHGIGRTPVRLLPSSPTSFFSRMVPFDIDFAVDTNGAVTQLTRYWPGPPQRWAKR